MRIPIRFILLGAILAEIAAFALAGQVIGVLGTLGLTVASTLAGVGLLRWQGVTTLMRVRADMNAGHAPTRALAETAMLGVAAVLMITPGLLTSAAGLLLFISPVRGLLWSRLARLAPMGQRRREAVRPARAELELHESDYHTTSRDTPWRRPDPRSPH